MRPNPLLGFVLLPCLTLLATACMREPKEGQADVLRVQFTPASQVWLADVQACAGDRPVLSQARSSLAIDLEEADLALRIGWGADTAAAYQIGSEELLVIVNPLSPISSLSVDQVRALFSGQATSWPGLHGSGGPVQVWVFPGGEDVQAWFEESIMLGQALSSSAHLAFDPQQMVQAVARDANAIGILPWHWLDETVSPVLSMADLPVLVLVAPGADPADLELVRCLLE
jgi:hypothetical protein